MSDSTETPPPAFHQDSTGTIRIGKSRITLDILMTEVAKGTDEAEIVRAYPVLRREDVTGTLAYFRAHPTELDAYLQRRSREAQELKRQTEERQKGMPSLSERMKARALSSQEQAQGGSSCR